MWNKVSLTKVCKIDNPTFVSILSSTQYFSHNMTHHCINNTSFILFLYFANNVLIWLLFKKLRFLDLFADKNKFVCNLGIVYSHALMPQKLSDFKIKNVYYRK